ncbi:MAG TPA: carboxypeptidase regulatory-like domain-containing protein [Myxococcales bacterium]|jgi:hypothetical protein
MSRLLLAACATSALFLAGCPAAPSSPDAGPLPSADAAAAGPDASAPGADAADTRPGSLTGKVEIFGRTDHSGAKVDVEGAALSATTAADGTFSLPGLLPGAHVLVASLDGYEPERRDVVVDPGASGSVAKITLRIAKLVNARTDVLPLGMLPGGSAFLYLAAFDPALGSGELHVFEPGTGDTKLADRVPNSGVLVNVNNPRLLAYASDLAYLSGMAKLAVYDFETHTSRTISESMFMGSVGFSPDGALLIGLADYDGQKGEGMLLAYSSDDAAVKAIAESVSPMGLQWGEDGRRLAFFKAFDAQAMSGDLHVWDRETGVVTQAVQGASFNGLMPAKDLSSVLYRTDADGVSGIGTLWLRKLSEPAATKLGEAACSNVKVTLDGKHVVFASGCAVDESFNQAGSLTVLDFATGLATPLAAGVGPDLVFYDAAETRLAYVANIDPTLGVVGTLGVWDLANGQGQSGLAANATRLNFGADGSKLTLITDMDADTRRGNLAVYDFATAELRQLATDANGYPVEVSPDGAHVLYLTGMDESDYTGATMWLQRVDGTEAAQKLGTDAAMGHLFSPHGERVAFLSGYANATATGTLTVWDVAAKSAASVTPGVNMTGVTFSGDAESLAYLASFDPGACRGSLHVWRSGTSELTLGEGVGCMDFRFAANDAAVLFKDGTGQLQIRYFDEATTRPIGQNVDFWSLTEDVRHSLLLYDTASLTEPVVTMSAWDLKARATLVLGERVGAPTRTMTRDLNRMIFLANYDSSADTGDLVAYDLVARKGTTLGSQVFWAGTAFDLDHTRMAFLSGYDRTTQTGTLVTTAITGDLAPKPVDGHVGFPVAVSADSLGYVSKPPAGPESWAPGLYVAKVAE